MFFENENKFKKVLSDSYSDDDIRHYLPDAKIIEYKDLSRYNNIFELLPEDKSYVFILVETKKRSGHWSFLGRLGSGATNGRLLYFDSYGKSVDEELKFIKVRMEYYEDQDQKYEFVNQYVLQYDMMPFIKEWMDECDDEIKSVKLLNKMKLNQLFCGDFVKCCLKLVNISKEIEKNAPPDLREKLEEGKGKIMKFICTNQSLYL